MLLLGIRLTLKVLGNTLWKLITTAVFIYIHLKGILEVTKPHEFVDNELQSSIFFQGLGQRFWGAGAQAKKRHPSHWQLFIKKKKQKEKKKATFITFIHVSTCI